MTTDILLSPVTYETLFLDRDGTINYQNTGRYITSAENFEFLPGALNAIKILSGLFKRIIVVTNQRGIHTGELSVETLEEIHGYLIGAVAKYGGRIDKVYWCGGDYGFPCRKPNPHMALWAQKDFPSIDFSRSVMIGDTKDDVKFGDDLGMRCYQVQLNAASPHIHLNSLLDVANFLKKHSEMFL